MTGPFVQNQGLVGTQHLVSGLGQGPEDVTRGADGFFYTGLQDGRIVRFGAGAHATVETYTTTGGRPLGLAFDVHGNLIVADAFKGLLSVAPGGTVSVLVDSVNGRPMLFVNDLDIGSDGTIWFSDASQKFGQSEFQLEFWECRPTGRLMSYEPRTGQTTVRLGGLMFANGVAVGPNDAYVLVSETTAARITRLWLKGPKAGDHDVFLDGLPGYPDNLSYNGNGIFWIALPLPRLKQLDHLGPRPFWRKVLMRLPAAVTGVGLKPYGWVIGVDPHGTVVRNLHDPTGGFGTVTSVNQFDGKLYLGSIVMTSVGRIDLPMAESGQKSQ